MRSILAIYALLGGLMIGNPSHAQGTSSSTVAPKQPSAPVGHRQPRQSDVANSPSASTPSPAAPATTPPGSQDMLDPDGRLNRVLKSICRGC